MADRHRTRGAWRGYLPVTCLLLVSTPAFASDELVVRVYAGVFNTDAWVYETDDTDTLEAGVEVQLAPVSRWQLRPLIGTSANQDEASLFYTGLQWRRRFAGSWLTAVSFALAHYEEGDSKALGSDLEFRSGIELAHAFGAGRQLGAQFYHISNAGLADSNPGNNSLVVFYSIPLRL